MHSSPFLLWFQLHIWQINRIFQHLIYACFSFSNSFFSVSFWIVTIAVSSHWPIFLCPKTPERIKTEEHLEHQFMGSSEVYFDDHASKKLGKMKYLSAASKSRLIWCMLCNTSNVRKISIFVHYKESCMEEDNLLDTCWKLDTSQSQGHTYEWESLFTALPH